MYVEFSDETKSVITGVFSCPQPTESAPFQGEVDAADQRYRAWWGSILQGTITGDLPKPER